MQSRWFELKEAAISLRLEGNYLKSIHRNLGIPLSTLSGWLKDIELSTEQTLHLQTVQRAALASARVKAAEWHRAQKTVRLLAAKKSAVDTLAQLDIDSAVLDLALAMLYFGEGAKTGDRTTIASSDPMILQLVIKILKVNYNLPTTAFRCELHLRMDQDPDAIKLFWSEKLGIPPENFTNAAFDKRSEGRKTYEYYKGVCVLHCGNVAIQRKLIYLYKLFCD